MQQRTTPFGSTMTCNTYRAGPLRTALQQPPLGSRAHVVPPSDERQTVTADSWPYPETTAPSSEPVAPRLGECANLLQMPASPTGGRSDVQAARMVEIVREAVARSTPEEALRGVI